MLRQRFRTWWNSDYDAVLLPEPLRAEAVDLLRNEEYFATVKLVGRRTDIGLIASKRAVDALADEEGLSRTA